MLAIDEEVIEDVVNAVRNKGPHPHIHDMEIARLQRSWPKLWIAIQRLIKAYDEEMS